MPAPTPNQDESREEFLDRCMAEHDTEDEDERRSECELSWGNAQEEEEAPEDAPPEDGARARRLRSINYNRGNAMNIKEIRQERAELMAEEHDLKVEARELLNRPMAETKREGLLASKSQRLDGIDERLIVLAQNEAHWERFRADEISQPAARKGSDDPENTSPANFPTPFKSFGEQLQAIAAFTNDPTSRHPGVRGLHQIMAAAPGGQEAVQSDGGFLVQTDFTAELLSLVHETGVLAQKCDRKPISANANGLKINAIDETSRVDGSRGGGVRAYWTAEAAALTDTKPKYRQMELSLQKLTGLYYATDELLADVVALGAFITAEFSDEFGFKVDDAIYRGSGGGMPLGVLGHAGTIDIPKETGQGANTILSENIEAMYARAWAKGLVNSEWYINQDVWPQLFRLNHVIGAGGVPMFILPGGMINAPFGALMGRPVTPIEQCETLGTSGDIMFADFSQYLIIEKGGIEAASSIHVQFLTDEMTFRFILRTDGQPKRNAALTPFKGTNTQSSFLTLATRA